MSGKSHSARGPQVEMEPEIGGKSEDVKNETKEMKSKDEMKMVR